MCNRHLEADGDPLDNDGDAGVGPNVILNINELR
jgi:hypothetical protein